MVKIDCNEISDEEANKDINSLFLPEEKSAFEQIDNDKEDKDVEKFLETGDERIFEEIYKNRKETLAIWARRWHYLMDSEEDMLGELNFYFSKAVFKYDRSKSKQKKGIFNNLLYTLLTNCIKNLQIGKLAKKRTPVGANPFYKQGFLLSLDYQYDKSEDSGTLMNILENKSSGNDNPIKSMCLEETLDTISNDKETKSILRDISNGETISSIIRDRKIVKGEIDINNYQSEMLRKKGSHHREICKIIKNKMNIDKKFSVVNYSANKKNKLQYIIEFEKTERADFVLKTIRKIRKNKRILVDKIN